MKLYFLHELNVFIAIFCIVSIFLSSFILRKRIRPRLLRRISALESLKRAIAESAETGREILFITGTSGIDTPSSVAMLSILGRIAVMSARSRSEVHSLYSDSMTLVVADSYVNAALRERNLDKLYSFPSYITNDRYAYASFAGTTIRGTQPSAIVLAGSFGDESLLMTEPSAATETPQIALCSDFSQIPFFLASSHSTAVGEELFYLGSMLSSSRDEVPGLMAADFIKIIVITIIFTGCVFMTWAEITGTKELVLIVKNFFEVY